LHHENQTYCRHDRARRRADDPADLASQTLQLTNQDDHPNLVQLWVEGDGEHDTNTPAPFIANPPILHMAAHAQQTVRLRFNGSQDLPQDRESVFYLNFTQVPALPDDGMDANQLVLLFQSRVKLFYRPQGLPAFAPNCQSLQPSREGDSVTLTNTGAYHMVVSRAQVLTKSALEAAATQGRSRASATGHGNSRLCLAV